MNFKIFIAILVISSCYGNIEQSIKTKPTPLGNDTSDEIMLTTTETPPVLAIYGGHGAFIKDYPWMSLLEYESDNGTYSLNCAGSLINHRYILTAAHCVSGTILTKVGKLIRIRLGEYDTSTKVDCVNGTCIDEVKYVPVEKIIVHEDYNDQNRNRSHDIALIRLSEIVEYTPFIQPIALPSGPGYNGSLVGDTVVVAGWGRTLSSRRTNTKMVLKITISDQQECAEKYNKYRIYITDMQLCAGGVFKEDTCDGDSGGPLMTMYNGRWVLEGIVSFGKACGLEGWPGIYTRVSKYDDWIANNIDQSSSTEPDSFGNDTSEEINLTTNPPAEIYGGHYALFVDFPWMSLLEYESDNGTYTLNCAGSLINQRYILTAAHCVSGKILTKVGRLIRVRLGEYDTSTKIDCVNGTCVNEVKYVHVEKIIVHEGYNEQNRNRSHDIALIRLSEIVEYTPFIQPIAVPSEPGYNGSLVGDTVLVAGWGRTLSSRKSNTKMVLEIKISDQEECAEKYKKYRIYITDMQLCAGGVFKEDTCDGDSGGPLMTVYEGEWVLEGIVSFGKACGLEGWPGIYTRVSKYDNWIATNIEL